jgi:hypothetical protein
VAAVHNKSPFGSEAFEAARAHKIRGRVVHRRLTQRSSAAASFAEPGQPSRTRERPSPYAPEAAAAMRVMADEGWFTVAPIHATDKTRREVRRRVVSSRTAAAPEPDVSAVLRR